MSDRTNAPLPALTELRDRHRSIVRRLAPLTTGIRSLLEDRENLAIVTKAVYDVEAAKADGDAWAKAGEPRFNEHTGWNELADALGQLEQAVDAFDRAGDPNATEEPAEAEQLRGWAPEIPAYALEDEAGMNRFRAELNAGSLTESMDGFRASLVETAHLAREVLLDHEGAEDVDGRPIRVVVEEHLAAALLLTTMVAEEALEGLRRKAEPAEAQAAVS